MDAPCPQGAHTEAGTLGDTLDDGGLPLPEAVGRRIAREQLGTVLDTLPARERALLVLRHGLDGTAPRTLKQVGAILSISGERTRQLELQALAQLRSHPLTAALRGDLT